MNRLTFIGMLFSFCLAACSGDQTAEGSYSDKAEGSYSDKAEGSYSDKAEGSYSDKAEGSSNSSTEKSSDDLYNAVNEPLEKAKEVEDILKQAAEERDAELNQ